MITLLQLDYFCKLAVAEHMTKTAQSLHISQTALSNAIRSLEESLGVQLFDRVGRSIKLNPKGKAYLEYVQKSFDLLEDGKRIVLDMDNMGNTLTLAIGTPMVWITMVTVPACLS